MAIVFRCKSCDARFEVDARLAGKTGRCKKCGAPMLIPRADEAPPRPKAPARAGATIRRDAPAPPIPDHPMNWIEAVTSQVALKPISLAAARPVARAATPLDDDDGPSGPYDLAQPLPAARPVSATKAAGALTVKYRQQWTGIAKFFRSINELSYLISVPFLIVLLMGAVFGNHSLAILGATIVVLLNVARLVSGVINMAAIPFREGPIQGLTFLIPPFTFFYLSQNWKRMRKPTGRVVEPLITIGLVILVFAFVPSLGSSKKAASGSASDRVRGAAQDLSQEIRGQLPDVNASGISTKARDALKGVKEQVGPAARSLGDKARGAVKGAGE